MNRFEIHTGRTTLRKFREEDLDDLFQVLGHPDVMKFSLSGPYSREKTAQFIEKCQSDYENRDFGLFAVEYRENRKVIGYCGFYHQHIDGLDEVEIGYRLHPDYWNRGLATETAKAVQNAGFKQYGFNRMISVIEPENSASIRVAEKNGMKYEKDAVFKGEVPVRIYSVERDSNAGPLI